MQIYLMQHGLALKPEVDPEEGLSPEGKKVIEASGRGLKALGVKLDHVVTSPKKRAMETAHIIAEALEFALEQIDVTEAAKAMAPPEDLMKFLDGYEGNVLIAGHLPSLANFAAMVTGGQVHVVNGGCIAIEEGKLLWSMRADQLAKIK